jgi:hypothetical protein
MHSREIKMETIIAIASSWAVAVVLVRCWIAKSRAGSYAAST